MNRFFYFATGIFNFDAVQWSNRPPVGNTGSFDTAPPETALRHLLPTAYRRYIRHIPRRTLHTCTLHIDPAFLFSFRIGKRAGFASPFAFTLPKRQLYPKTPRRPSDRQATEPLHPHREHPQWSAPRDLPDTRPQPLLSTR